MQFGAYEVDILLQGFPGKTLNQGGLAWSTVALLRGHGRVAVLNTGNFNVRRVLDEALRARGVAPEEVTDLILSHLHYDHMINWPMFPTARPLVGAQEMAWALNEPAGNPLVPELYVEALARHPRLHLLEEGDTVLPGLTAHLGPGHTPGHLFFLLDGGERDLLLVQDVAKYRAELLTRRTDMTFDPTVSAASIEKIWSFWRRKPGTMVLPGHDLPMLLVDGQPTPIGVHDAGVIALFGDSIDDRTLFAFQPG